MHNTYSRFVVVIIINTENGLSSFSRQCLQDGENSVHKDNILAIIVIIIRSVDMGYVFLDRRGDDIF